MERAPKQERPRRPFVLSDERLRAAAYRYLERFAATEAHLVRVLTRKIKRGLGPDAEPEALAAGVEAARRVAALCVRLGLVDDAAYAAATARRLHREGKPVGRIVATLAVKGVERDEADAAIEALSEEAGVERQELDLAAAIAFARRRRLGVFARPPAATATVDMIAATRRKAYAAFARAGFPYGLAAKVLEAEDAEALDALLFDEGSFGL